MNSTLLGTLLLTVSSVAFAQWEFHSFKGERTQYSQTRQIEDPRYEGNANVCAHESTGGYRDGKCYTKLADDKIVISDDGASATISIQTKDGDTCAVTGDGIIGTPDELTLFNVHRVGTPRVDNGNDVLNQCLITIEDQRTGMDVLNNGKCAQLCPGTDIQITNAQKIK